MRNINRDYHIKVDVKNSKVIGDSIFFYTSDVNTCNLYIEVVNEVVDDTLELRIVIVPPKATTRADVIELKATKHSNQLFEVQLPNDIAGTYNCEFKCISGDKFNTSDNFIYTVRKNLIGDDK